MNRSRNSRPLARAWGALLSPALVACIANCAGPAEPRTSVPDLPGVARTALREGAPAADMRRSVSTSPCFRSSASTESTMQPEALLKFAGRVDMGPCGKPSASAVIVADGYGHLRSDDVGVISPEALGPDRSPDTCAMGGPPRPTPHWIRALETTGEP